VPYVVAAAPDGTADAADAHLFKGTVTFLPGVVSKYVTVASYGDTIPEPDQHVNVTLGTPIGGATIDKGVGLVTLKDDDSDGIPPSTITVSIGDVNIVEGNDGTRTAYMPVFLSSPATVSTKVGFVIDCSAAALLDEASVKMSGTITFAIGSRAKYLPLSVLPDTTPEQIMQIYADITSKISSVQVLDNRGDATIDDDDGALPAHPGYAVPNFAAESLPTGSTFNAQAVGDQEMIDQTPAGNPGTFQYTYNGKDMVLGTGQRQVGLSEDGRYTAFTSPQTDLVPGDTNGMEDVFVRDRATGTTERVSLRQDGTQVEAADAPVGPYAQTAGYRDVSISANGRYVAYSTNAALDPRDSSTTYSLGDSDFYEDVYLYDRVLHTTELVSVDSNGNHMPGGTDPTVSADGRYVLFNGGLPSTGNSSNVYVRDRVAGTTTLVYDSAMYTDALALSANGRFAVVPSHGSGCFDEELVVVDLLDGSVERVDVNDNGEGGAQDEGFKTILYTPVISADGRFVAFKTDSWNLIPGMTGPAAPLGDLDTALVRIYVRDLALKSTSMVGSPSEPVFPFATLSMSDDGNLVSETAEDWSIPAVSDGTPNAVQDAALFDRAAGTAERLAFTVDGWNHTGTQSGAAALSGDGRYFGFVSPYWVIYEGVELSDAWVQRVR
jgi:hypothetical protein